MWKEIQDNTVIKRPHSQIPRAAEVPMYTMRAGIHVENTISISHPYARKGKRIS